MKAEKRRKKF